MPSESVDDVIMHMTDPNYNPQQAHEYYLRTRKLKGRTPGVVKSTTGRVGATPLSVVKAKPRPKVPVKTPAQHHKELEARVAALHIRLDKLKKVLALLVKQAKARSGVPDPKKTAAAKKAAATRASTKAPSKLTAKQQADKAKAAKAYYEKHKNDPTDANVKDIEKKIAEVTAKIVKMREQLASAKKQVQNHKPVPVGAGSKSK